MIGGDEGLDPVNESNDESEEIPPGTFVEEESDDDEEGEFNWMDYIGVAVGQIESEPEDSNPPSSPLFQLEEEKIRKITPDNTA